MANSNSSRTLVPEAKDSLNQFKYEVASDMCVKNIFKHYLLATSFFIYAIFFFNSFISFNSLNLK